MAPYSVEVSGTEVTKELPRADASALFHAFFLAHPSIRYVRFQWQDLSGVLRARILPLPQAVAVVQQTRSLSIGPVAFHFLLGNSFVPDIDARGRHELLPDWTSLWTRPGLDADYASVMCTVVEHFPTRPIPNLDMCPRNALENMVRSVREKMGVEVLIGFEVEFEIMKKEADGKHVPWAQAMGAFAVSSYRDPAFAYVEEVLDVLENAGVKVDTIQAECFWGQYEITLPPMDPIRAIDQLILVQDTLKHVFIRHGLVATMAPRPVASSAQSIGQHAHISINPPVKEESFLAGILQRLPQLLAFCLPYELSYERVKEHYAGTMVAWGTENRGVPVRKIGAAHWEMRFIDASANMYLALTAILGAGLAGFAGDEPLTWPDTSLGEQQVPSEIVALPKSIDIAMTKLEEAKDTMEAVMESRILRHYLRVKKFEVEHLRQKDVEQVRGLMVDVF